MIIWFCLMNLESSLSEVHPIKSKLYSMNKADLRSVISKKVGGSGWSIGLVLRQRPLFVGKNGVWRGCGWGFREKSSSVSGKMSIFAA